MSAPSVSVRLPQPLRERVAAHARLERRSFSNALRVLVGAGLAAPAASVSFDDVDPDAIERLARLAGMQSEASREHEVRKRESAVTLTDARAARDGSGMTRKSW